MNATRQILACILALTCISLAALGGCEEKQDTSASRSEGPKEPPPAHAGSTAVKQMLLRSPAFEPDEPIPAKYTGEGQDVSPPLTWSEVPEGTRELALILEDPDAPRPEPWVHWVVYKIPAGATDLPPGIPREQKLSSPAGALQGINSWPTDNIGYRGPMPPEGHGLHHYHFRLYALDTPVSLGPGASAKELLKAISDHVLAEGELVGTYQR